MNQEVKKKWIEALKSGKYKQTANRLRDNTGYCCLGVLCDLYSKEKNIDDFIKREGGDFLFMGHGGLLPRIIVDWAELNGTNPKIIYKNSNRTLASLNDEGKNFEEIADIIEEKL